MEDQDEDDDPEEDEGDDVEQDDGNENDNSEDEEENEETDNNNKALEQVEVKDLEQSLNQESLAFNQNPFEQDEDYLYDLELTRRVE